MLESQNELYGFSSWQGTLRGQVTCLPTLEASFCSSLSLLVCKQKANYIICLKIEKEN